MQNVLVGEILINYLKRFLRIVPHVGML
uniref:Uncharacterized protein n=1 Tax=Arundo donax TaxID=35708 RepID=A0A0A9AS48_ARUDO